MQQILRFWQPLPKVKWWEAPSCDTRAPDSHKPGWNISFHLYHPSITQSNRRWEPKCRSSKLIQLGLKVATFSTNNLIVGHRVRTLTGKEIDLGKKIPCSSGLPQSCGPNYEAHFGSIQGLEPQVIFCVMIVCFRQALLTPSFLQTSSQTTRFASSSAASTKARRFSGFNLEVSGCSHQGASGRKRGHTTCTATIDLWRKTNVRLPCLLKRLQ